MLYSRPPGCHTPPAPKNHPAGGAAINTTTNLNIVALDLSLTQTGVCNQHGQTHTLKPPKQTRGTDRLAWYYTAIGQLALTANLVALEGYGYASQSIAATAELGGVARLAIHHAGAHQLIIAPKSIKKYATGNGNAPKAAVISAAVTRANHPFTTDDEADAWWLWQLANDLYHNPQLTMPKTHRAALNPYQQNHPTESSQ